MAEHHYPHGPWLQPDGMYVGHCHCGINFEGATLWAAEQAWNAHALASSPTAAALDKLTPEDAWQDLLDKDDRTSPEEYPEMALITFAELQDYMTAALDKDAEIARDISGETVCGFRVAAWRETHPDPEVQGHRYSEHWSTPNTRHPNVKVERLFTEDQLRAALTQGKD